MSKWATAAIAAVYAVVAIENLWNGNWQQFFLFTGWSMGGFALASMVE